VGLLLLRYGEIALKGQNRIYFFRKLRRNVRLCLKSNGLSGEVWQEGQRVYVETEQVEEAIQAVRKVFGLVSLSPAHIVAADIDAVTEEAVSVALREGVNQDRSFRVKARRSDKSFPHISPEVERHVGAAIGERTGATVDLSSQADAEIGVEIQRARALVYGRVIAGPGGMPLSSQGRVVALLSSGIDSPVAAWMMMKRGCGVIPVHFSVSQAQTEQVKAIVEALNQYAYGWTLEPVILSHDEILGPTLSRLREIRAERWTCLFCKRALLAKAAEIAEDRGASALVTGDSLGQVASQTLSNLEVISYGIEKPILRPLIGFDKTEIMAMARRIGTYDASTKKAHACPFLPDRPLTQASVEKLRGILDQLEGAKRVHSTMAEVGEHGLA
jgi:thiamine biosynthesis protein ThiI